MSNQKSDLIRSALEANDAYAREWLAFRKGDRPLTMDYGRKLEKLLFAAYDAHQRLASSHKEEGCSGC